MHRFRSVCGSGLSNKSPSDLVKISYLCHCYNLDLAVLMSSVDAYEYELVKKNGEIICTYSKSTS